MSVLHRWTSLIKTADKIDIIIMVMGFITMHLTFVSLFRNMRSLNSRFWLAFTVLISSTFSFLLALTSINAFQIPIELKLLSEGLPFLVVTIGFEKPFILTKAVLRGVKSLSTDTIHNNVIRGINEKAGRYLKFMPSN